MKEADNIIIFKVFFKLRCLDFLDFPGKFLGYTFGRFCLDDLAFLQLADPPQVKFL
jgi:hypothetical protein